MATPVKCLNNKNPGPGEYDVDKLDRTNGFKYVYYIT